MRRGEAMLCPNGGRSCVEFYQRPCLYDALLLKGGQNGLLRQHCRPLRGVGDFGQPARARLKETNPCPGWKQTASVSTMSLLERGPPSFSCMRWAALSTVGTGSFPS